MDEGVPNLDGKRMVPVSAVDRLWWERQEVGWVRERYWEYRWEAGVTGAEKEVIERFLGWMEGTHEGQAVQCVSTPEAPGH